MTERPVSRRSKEYNRGWADGNAAALDACNPIIENLQARLAATTSPAPADAPLDVLVERVAEAVEQSEYICDGYDFGTCPDALRAAIRAALAQQAEPRPEPEGRKRP